MNHKPQKNKGRLWIAMTWQGSLNMVLVLLFWKAAVVEWQRRLLGMPSFRLSLLNNHKEHITSDDDLILAKSEYVGKQMGF